MRAHRVLALPVLVLGALAWGGPPVASQTAPGVPPRVFETSTSASAVLGRVSVPVAFPLGVDAGSMVSSVRTSSTPLVVSEASLVFQPLLVTVAGPTPAYCTAYFPSTETDVACGGPTQGTGPVGASAASGNAKASGETFEADGQLAGQASTRASGLGSAAGAPVPMSIGSVATAARSGPEGDKVVAGASSAITEVDIGGVLRIESIRSSVSGAVSGRAGGAAVSHTLDVSGATVAGQRVEITPDGVEAGGQQSGQFPLADTQTAVNEALVAAGLQVRLVPPDAPVASEDGRTVTATSGGVGVSFRDSTGTNIFYLFGQSTLDMFGSLSEVSDGAVSEPDPGLAAGGGTESAESAGSDPVVSSPGSPVPVTDTFESAAPPAPVPGEGAASPTREVLRPTVATVPVSIRSWQIPYLPFALLVVSLPLLSIARRLPLRRRFT